MLHPKTDIRSIFNKTPGQNCASAAAPVITVAIVSSPPPHEKNKKVIKKNKIKFIFNAYLKTTTGKKHKEKLQPK